METFTTWLIGGGALLIIVCLLLGLAELALIRTVRPPKQRTFTFIRLTETQYQTVVAPAFGALCSGLIVSISAAFIYEGFTEEADSWKPLIGVIVFMVAALVLFIALWSALKTSGEPIDLARDPFSIRAAAEESASAARNGGLNPDDLKVQLNEWVQNVSAHSMNLVTKKNSKRLENSFKNTAEQQCLLRSLVASFQIYWAASLAFPLKFLWPFLGFTLFISGIVLHIINVAGHLAFVTSWGAWGALCGMAFFAAIPTFFYCTARGNRARLWNRVYLTAIIDANAAIETAKTAHAAVKAENDLIQRVLEKADSFLPQHPSSPGTVQHTIMRLGRFRLTKDITLQRVQEDSSGSVLEPQG